MARTFKLSDSALSVLRNCVANQNSITLPAGQLDRKLYTEVNDALTALGGKWNRKAGKHLFENDPREGLNKILGSSGEVENKKQIFQSFYTPTEVIRVMVRWLDLNGWANLDGDKLSILEPSCGDGRIMDYLVSGGIDKSSFTAYDIDPKAVMKARAKGYNVEERDFLTVEPSPIFDRVIMNPPFTKNQDIQHVLHAFKFLRKGGRLVSIMSPSWVNGARKIQIDFRIFVFSINGQIVELEAGAFKESGTMVSSVIVVLEKR